MTSSFIQSLFYLEIAIARRQVNKRFIKLPITLIFWHDVLKYELFKNMNVIIIAPVIITPEDQTLKLLINDGEVKKTGFTTTYERETKFYERETYQLCRCGGNSPISLNKLILKLLLKLFAL